jgi:glycosyltransferase involved in cell wall biosynthesis
MSTGTERETVAAGGAVARQGRYCLISPCRDEEAFMRRTLDSVSRQTVLPALWVIVDDGSTDGSPAILAEYAKKLDYLRVIRREDRGRRSVGPGVIDAFYAGFETVDKAKFDYLCKLDVDLDLPPKYFETLIRRMEAEPRLGSCSGKPYFTNAAGSLVSEKIGDEVSCGASKFYRRACFEQIGGFVREVMWDGIDNHRSRMLGWTVRSWDEPELRFLHLRPMGSSEHGILRGRMRHGFGQYFMGTGPAFMTASAIFRMTRRPWIIGGLAMWWGYVSSFLNGKPRYDDPEFRRFVRRYQWSSLFRGKAAAVRRIEERWKDRWKPPAS